ncbi:MAG: hypothetical protein PHF60_01570 [Candidatus ainarchaeum sp.]|nr:hypothetical protein [Candidatus ainarchaeum sp.]
MAQTQVEGPVAGSRLTADQQGQIKIIDNLKGATSMVLKPDALAGNLVRMWQVLEVLRAGRPPKDTPERTVYNRAVSTLGNDNADAAISALNTAFITGIKNLVPSVKGPEDAGVYAPQLLQILNTIQAKAGDPEYFESYAAYGQLSTELPYLRDKLSGGLSTDNRQTVGSVSSAMGILRPVELYQPMGNIFRIETSKKGDSWAVGGPATDEMSMAFGGDKAATQDFVNALSSALAYKYDGAAQKEGCKALLDAMDGVANEQMRNDPHFKNALDYLNKGQRDKALDELSELGALYNSLYNSANNLVIVRINQDALRIFSGSTTVVFDLAGSTDDFEKYLASSGDERESMGRALVQAAVTVSYDLLRLTGQVETGRLNQQTGDFEKTGKNRKITTKDGSSWALTARPELRIATSVGAQPVKFILHCAFGYMKYDFGKITLDTGTTQKQVTLKQGQPFLGVYGMEVQLPMRAGKHAVWDPKRPIERIGIGSVGTEMQNAFAYVTLGITPVREGDRIWQILVTPIYSGFLDQLGKYWPRVGVDLDVAAVAKQFQNQMKLTVGAPLRLDMEIDKDTGDVRGYRLTPSLNIGYTPIPGLTISGGPGYAWNVKGESAMGTGGWFGALNLTIDSGMLAAERGTVAGGAFGTAVPMPTSDELLAQTQISKAVDFVNMAKPTDVSGPKGQQMAKDLATLLGKQDLVRLTNDDSDHLMTAIDLLKQGKLREGLDELSSMTTFTVNLR